MFFCKLPTVEFTRYLNISNGVNYIRSTDYSTADERQPTNSSRNIKCQVIYACASVIIFTRVCLKHVVVLSVRGMSSLLSA